MSEMTSPEPKKIDEILQKHSGLDVVGDVRDSKRAKAVQQQDLVSEVDGLTAEITDIEADMARTGDPNLVDARDSATQASLEAQRDLRELSEE